MFNDFFDLDEDIKNVKKIIDPSNLSDDSRLIYDTYLSITDLKELPYSDNIYIAQVARTYYVSPLCIALKDTIAKNSSFIKAKEDGRIKDFHYVLNFLNILNNTRIKKVNYEQQFNNIDKFLEDNSENESFIVLIRYIEDGKIPILNSDDTKDMYNIFNFYSPEEIDLAIKECKNNNNNLIYNLKFLYYILKKNKSERQRIEEKWEEMYKEMNCNVRSLFEQKEYVEEESIKDKEYYNKISEEIIEEIKKLKK
ncbi:MAG: hypothetical protein M0Q13_13340 [Methanothrix sp.]|jgi:hypothetical protein|nr:hypothetical protein [Methanothrix sp.]